MPHSIVSVLKRMAKWAVTNIVEQGREKRHFLSIFVRLDAFFGEIPIDNPNQSAGSVKDADAMREAGVGGSGKNEFGNA